MTLLPIPSCASKRLPKRKRSFWQCPCTEIYFQLIITFSITIVTYIISVVMCLGGQQFAVPSVLILIKRTNAQRIKSNHMYLFGMVQYREYTKGATINDPFGSKKLAHETKPSTPLQLISRWISIELCKLKIWSWLHLTANIYIYCMNIAPFIPARRM